jgi:hypothetical protein
MELTVARRALATSWRWALAGLAIGVAVGGVFAVVAAAGGRSAWAGMLLPAGVLSFPAGLWTIDAMVALIQRGRAGAELATLVVGPAVNGTIVGAVLGALSGVVDGSRRSKRARGP